ncbi:MAG TPA: CoA-transferase, partial [Stellaceae bacterium]|nr:CoA-transferase [Stellaceae bacterium]
YRDAGRNFNPVMAAAAALTIAQTQHVAELGELSPEEIATPGIYVDRLVHVEAGDPPLKT